MKRQPFSCNRQTKSLFLAVANLILWVAGCGNPSQPPSQSSSNDPKTMIERGQYAAAKAILDGQIAKPTRAIPLDQAYYLHGLCERGIMPESPAAALDFNRALQITHDPEVTQLANIALGHIHFESATPDYARAVHFYQAALQTMSRIPPKDLVLYRTGAALQYIGNFKQAETYFSQCVKDFPNSPYTPLCSNYQNAAFFTVQLGVFSSSFRAQSLIREASGKGITCESDKIQKEGKTLYAVRCGKYANQIAANTALTVVKRHYPDAMITPAQ